MWDTPPGWLQALARLSLVVAGICAVLILLDIFVAKRRQQMTVMEWVWPITALYAGPLALLAYRRFGRPQSPRWRAERGLRQPPDKPAWAAYAVGVSHCGAGCTLGDIIAEFGVFFLALTITGEALFAEYVGDYILAVGLGLVFQYLAIAPMRGLGLRKGIAAAAKADILSLTAFEVGLFGWMALTSFVFFDHKLHPDNPVYWFMMQIGMVVGFATAYPMNWWLIKKGIKEAM